MSKKPEGSSFLSRHHRLNGTKTRDAPQEEQQAKTCNPPLANKSSNNDYSHHQEITHDTFANSEIWFETHGSTVFVD